MMDKASHDNAGPRTETEPTSPPPAKRPRTDHPVMNDHRGKSAFDFPRRLTFQRSISSPSALNTPPKSPELMDAAEHGGFHEPPQDTKLNVTPVTEVTTSHDQIARAGSPDEDMRHKLPLSQRPATETDQPGSYAGEDLSAPLVSAASDHPGGKSPEEETPEDRSLTSGGDKEVTSEPDCTLKDNHTSVFESNFPEVSGTNQLKFFPTIPSEEERESPVSSSDCADPQTLRSDPEEDPSRNLAGAEENARTEFDFQIRGDGSSGTRSRVNESRKNAGERAERSIPASDEEAVGNAAAENARFEVDCGGTTAVPAGVGGREAAEGGNDAGPFAVIDPAICSEADGEAEEKRRDAAERAAGGESSPPVNTSEAEAPLALGADVTPSPDRGETFNRQSGTWPEENEEFNQSCVETQVGSIIPSMTHDTEEKVGTESDERRSSETEETLRREDDMTGTSPETKPGDERSSDLPVGAGSSTLDVSNREREGKEGGEEMRSDGVGEQADADDEADLEGERRRTADIRDDLLTSTSDAVVPCQRRLSPSRNCADRLSLSTSAFAFHDLGGFDTFEKIQLSPDEEEEEEDDGVDGGNGIPPLARQRFEAAQPEGTPEEGEHESASSLSFRHELPNFIYAAEAAAVQQADETDPRSASTRSSSPSNPDFEMKRQFDAVLRELHLFFEISRNDCSLSAPGRGDVTDGSGGGDASECKARRGGPEVGHRRDTSSDDLEDDRSLGMCESEPLRPPARDGEQEVPLSSAPTLREQRETQRKARTWCPSFEFAPHSGQLIDRPLRRLEPLQTCTRPIRVGLSKRAKIKRLHHPRPRK